MATNSVKINMNRHSFYDQPRIGAKPKRTTFPRKNKHLTSFNTGNLFIIDADLIMPNDTINNMHIANLTRQLTIKVPVMDDAYLNKWVFFIPFRLIFDETAQFFGSTEGTSDDWDIKDQPNLPIVTWDGKEMSNGTKRLLDYMGVHETTRNEWKKSFALSKTNFSTGLCELYLRAYYKVWNDYFRDQNYQKELLLNKTRNAQPVHAYELQKVNKIHDYFTSLLPAPQKGDAVSLTLAGSLLPLVDTSGTGVHNIVPLRVFNGEPTDGHVVPMAQRNVDVAIAQQSYKGNENAEIIYGSTWGIDAMVDATRQISITVNQLRESFALQRILELNARNGSRYTEYIESHFGIHAPDARLDRAELLGSSEELLENQQVDTTAKTGDNQDQTQGWLGAYGQTVKVSSGIQKTFTEHGILLTLGAVRTNHSYQQGIERHLAIQTLSDLYDPQFDGIGDQVVTVGEIYSTGNKTQDKKALGFQEYAAHYRYKQNQVSGFFSSGLETGSLDYWHYADDYEKAPTINKEWMSEQETNVDRTLTVGSKEMDQWIAEFIITKNMTRPMPLYNIPGLEKM